MIQRFRTAGTAEHDPRPLVGVVVVNYNGLDDTLRCLSALRWIAYPHLVVHVVDNGSDEDEGSAVAAAFPDASVARSDVNRGFAVAADEAMQRALDDGADYVLFLNNDAFLCVDALDRLVDALERDPRTGVVGPRVRRLDDPSRIQNLGYAYDDWFGIPRAIGAGKPAGWVPSRSSSPAWIMGCALLARRCVLEATGGFDPAFFLYSEDHDLCVRARRLGYEIRVVPQADVLHRKTTSSEYSQRHVYHVFASHLLFIARTARRYRWPTLTVGAILIGLALASIAAVRRGTFVLPTIVRAAVDVARGKPRRDVAFPARGAEARAFVGVVLAVAVGIVVRPVLQLHEPPAYRHDWHWPLLQSAFAWLPSFATSAWSPQNLGAPNLPYATDLVLLLSEAALGALLGVKASLDVLLVVMGAAAALGAARLCRALLGRWDAAALTVAGATYVASPVFSDQLVAGHLDDLAAVAAFPWLVLGLLSFARAPRGGTLALTALAGGLCAVQVQYLVLILVPVGWSLGAFRSRAALVAGLATFGFVVVANAPTLYQIGRTHAAAAILQNDRAAVGEEVRQSAPLVAALVGGGYPLGYDRSTDRSNGVARALAALALGAPLCLLACLATGRRSRAPGVVLLGIYATGVATIAGLAGPAAPLWSWLFANVAAASLMRELFHAAPLVALPLAVAVGLVASRRRLAVVALVLFVALDRWSLSGGAAGWLTAARPVPSDVRRLVDELARTPGDARVVVVPGRQPVHDFPSGSVGVDALEYYPLGAHWTFFEYAPTAGIDALASDLLLRGPERRTRELLQRLSVAAILVRPLPGADVLHALVPWPGAGATAGLIELRPRPLVYGAAPPLLVGGDLSRLLAVPGPPDVLALMRQQPAFVAAGAPYRVESAEADDRRLAAGCARFVVPPPSRLSDDATRAWVPAHRYGYLDPAFDYPVSDAILTAAGTPPPLPALPGGARILAGVFGSPAAAYRWTDRLPARIPFGHVLVVAGYLVRTSPACRPFVPGAVSPRARVEVGPFARSSPVALRGTLRVVDGAGTVVFTDAYDPGWQLRLDGVALPADRHFAADGFANGWIVTGSARARSFALVYAPAGPYDALTAVGLISWAGVLVAAVAFRLRRTPRAV